MADVGGVGNRGMGPLPAGNQALEKPVGQPGQSGLRPDAMEPSNFAPAPLPQTPDGPIGPRGPLGQPTGMPVPVEPGKTEQLLPDVIAGRDPTQLIAAEQMRQAAAGR